MIPKSLLSVLLALVLAWVATARSETLYETGFEEFTPGEIHEQNDWSANYGTETALCTIVASDAAPLAAAGGSQMLHLIRPSAGSVPATGIIFHRDPKPLLNFTVEFEMAYEAKTDFPLFQFQIGSAADSESGVRVGIGFFEETKASRLFQVYHGHGSERTPVPAPESREALPTEPLVFYHFTLRLHGDGHLYDLSVRHDGKVIAAVKDQSVPWAAKNYNRLIISLPGGSRDDQLFFDQLKIAE
ncbi:MAG TPA: hypothetical protein VNQ90_08170 [Chthoniobacteraceae bacterium]|nr:hypothetical protein [Chthoniobacteraceae bacterium]